MANAFRGEPDTPPHPAERGRVAQQPARRLSETTPSKIKQSPLKIIKKRIGSQGPFALKSDRRGVLRLALWKVMVHDGPSRTFHQV